MAAAGAFCCGGIFAAIFLAWALMKSAMARAIRNMPMRTYEPRIGRRPPFRCLPMISNGLRDICITSRRVVKEARGN